MSNNLIQPKGSVSKETNIQSIARITGSKIEEVKYLEDDLDVTGLKYLYDSSTETVWKLNGDETGTVDSWIVQDDVMQLLTSNETYNLKLANSYILYKNELKNYDGLKYIGSVSNLNKLREIEPTNAGQKIILDSISDNTIIGGGIFKYVDDTTLVDDGGIVIKTNGGKFWVRDINVDEIDITWFGANTNSDCTSIFEKILNKYNNIYIPNGIYQIGYIQFSSLNDKKIYGNGTLSLTALNGIKFQNCNNVSIDKINIECYGSGSTGLTFLNSTNIKINSIILSKHGVGGGLRYESCSTVSILKSTFLNAANDTRFNQSTSCDINIWGTNNDFIICNNVFTSNGGYAIQARSHSLGDVCKNVLVSNNIIDGYNSYGINFYRNKQSITDTQQMYNMTITSNIIKNITGSRPATIGGNDKTFGCGIYLQGSEYTIVSDNNIMNVCSETNNDLLAPAGIGVTNCGNYTLTNNIINTSGYYGIKINDSVLNPDGSTGLGDQAGKGTVSNNTISNVNLDGIMIQDRNNISITGNSIQQSSRNGIQINTSPSSTSKPITYNKIINDNIINNITGIGIFLGYSTRFNISNNKIGITSQGISIGNSNNGEISGNNIYGSTSRAIYISSNNTVEGSIQLTNNITTGSALGTVIEYPSNYINSPFGNPSGTYADLRAITADLPNVWGLSFSNVNPTSAISITNFVGGYIGQKVSLWINNTNTTFIHSSPFLLKGATNYNPPSNTVMTFLKTKAGWVEVSRTQ